MDDIEFLKDRAVKRDDLGFEEAKEIWEMGKEKPFLVLSKANEIVRAHKGRSVSLCMIVNAKSGLCTEDCKFCAQSVHYGTDITTYPLLDEMEILARAKHAKEEGAHYFGIVTSGRSLKSSREWETIQSATSKIKDLGLKPCASLGFIDEEEARRLKRSGLFRYHHNLETSRDFFKNICTTHGYEEKVETIKNAKKAGLSVCSGGIIGMGEGIEDRIKLALTLRELDVDSVPINILNPRPGTPLYGTPPLSPLEILISIAIFRFLLPKKDIKICAGKEIHLRQLLPLAFVAGCNSIMTGSYLTTSGRSPKLDKEMIEDLGLSWHVAEDELCLEKKI